MVAGGGIGIELEFVPLPNGVGSEIRGLDPREIGGAEEAALLERLREFATQSRFVYWHEWKTDDLIIWNNYRALHSAAGHKNRYVRTMNRTTLTGEIHGRRAA